MPSDLATVLVVEDEALIALDLQALLEHAGYRVLGPANSPAVAFNLLEANQPDVALLDINLGRTDAFAIEPGAGFGSTTRIRRDPRRHRRDLKGERAQSVQPFVRTPGAR